jgi:hypothetical protein
MAAWKEPAWAATQPTVKPEAMPAPAAEPAAPKAPRGRMGVVAPLPGGGISITARGYEWLESALATAITPAALRASVEELEARARAEAPRKPKAKDQRKESDACSSSRGAKTNRSASGKTLW